MDDLQPLFRRYGVNYEHVDKVEERFRTEVETNYLFHLKQRGAIKSHILLDHDVLLLSHMRKIAAQESEAIVCLTWDASMIAVAQELEGCGWVVNPTAFADLVQPRLSLTGSRLCSLAHHLARVRERPSEASARILDRVVRMASKEQLSDWQFRARIRDFRNDIMSRVDLTGAQYQEWIDQETDRQLESEGIDVKARIGQRLSENEVDE